jgi:hypothetical protein
VFAVTCIEKKDLILRLSWLRKHNPEVDWTTGRVKMSCCPSVCSTCHKEVWTECKAHYSEVCQICTCHAGPFPHSGVEMEEICATGTFSQWLAEAHLQNTTSKSFRNSILDYLHKYEDIFAKESFNTLLEQCQ